MRSLDYLNCSVLKEIIDLKNIFINGFTKALKSFPHEVDQRQNWKESIKLTIDNFLQESNLISIEDKKIYLIREYLKTHKTFLKWHKTLMITI